MSISIAIIAYVMSITILSNLPFACIFFKNYTHVFLANVLQNLLERSKYRQYLLTNPLELEVIVRICNLLFFC